MIRLSSGFRQVHLQFLTSSQLVEMYNCWWRPSIGYMWSQVGFQIRLWRPVGRSFPLRELDVAMFQMVKLEVAVLGRSA